MNSKVIQALAAYPTLASIFTDNDTDNRAWNEDGTIGIFLEANGTVSLLDSEGYPMHTYRLTIRHAEHLAATNNIENWDFFATAQ